MTGYQFETLGNASIQFFAAGAPLLITDPWLLGTCYYESWALDNPPDQRQIENAVASDYVWISHGHPDHLHPESLALFNRGTRALVADHYNDEIAQALKTADFDVTVMPYRHWHDLGHGVEVMAFDNPEQDSILIIRTPDSLIVNLNDSLPWGEQSFLRSLVRQCPTDKTFLLAICDYSGDMRNIVDGEGDRLSQPVAKYKESIVRGVANRADALGVRYYCSSSSQHHYMRADSMWANAYKINFDEVSKYWSRPDVQIVEPFVTIDLDDLEITRNHPGQTSAPVDASSGTGCDDWSVALTAEDWHKVEAFFRRIETLNNVVDFITITVAGEQRTLEVPGSAFLKTLRRRRGIHFHAPRHSLMETVGSGYFDDLLLGNFMRTELIGARLYPHFTPRIAKYGPNAKVTTNADLRRFWQHYRRRNPRVYLRWRLVALRVRSMRIVASLAEHLGVEPTLRRLYWYLRGDRR